MRSPRQAIRIVSGALALAGLACLWLFFAPTAIGGSTSWVVTDGISMEPHFHAGDLVLVRQESDYRVGQIVAYRNKQLGTTVLHRIVARAGSRYVFKGDNNNFQDFEHPTRSQLLGALWIHVPGAGADLASIRSPALIGGLFAAGILLLGGAAFTRRRRRRHRERRNEQRARKPLAVTSWPAPGVLAFGLAAILPFVALALLAFTRPTVENVSTSAAYEQRGSLSYSAHTPSGPAYPDGHVGTGDPLFTHVVGAVDFAFAYRFASSSRHRVSARGALSATIASTSGWTTTLPLGRAQTLHNGGGELAATLDLAALLRLVSRVEAITAVRGSYTVTIAPAIVASGAIDGSPLRARFSPETKFSLNQLEMRPVTASGAASEATTAAGSFSHTATGTVTVRRSRPAHLSLVLVKVPVAGARAIALIGIAAVLFALLAASALARTGVRDETTRILSRYGSAIVPVAQIWQQPGVAVIDVTDFESLLKIAAHYERSILHERADYGDAFWVTDESGQFRYAIWASATEPAMETAESEEPLEGILAADTRPERRADTIEFGAASQATLAPQGY